MPIRGFEIYEEKCGECLFSKNRIVDKKRMKQLLSECEKEDTYFICHKSSIANDGDIACKGWFDSGMTSRQRRLAEYLGGEETGVITFVPLPKDKDENKNVI